MLRRLLRAASAALLLLTLALPAAAQTVVTSIASAGDQARIQTINKGAVALQISGTWTGTIAFECTVDGTNWAACDMLPLTGATPASSATANGAWSINASGLAAVRVRTAAGLTGPALLTFSVGDAAGRAVAAAAASSVNATIVAPLGATTAANSVPVALATDQTFRTSLESSAMSDAGTSVTPKFATISAATSGNNTIVAAVSSKKIRVLAVCFTVDAAVNTKFQSGASGTDITGLQVWDAAAKGLCAGYNPVGWFQTAATTLLNLNLSGNVGVHGFLVYIEVS